MENKKKLTLMKIFAIVLLIVIVTSFGIATTEFREDKLMDDYVSVKEVVSELQFSIYSAEEWKDFFSVYKEAYITREMVYNVLVQLGVSELISFDEVGKQKAVSRTEWNGIYEQLIDYLDIENQVDIGNVLVLASEEGAENNLLYTNEGIFSTTLPIAYFADWEGYEVYLFGTECVGVAEKADTEYVIANTYVINAAEDTLTFLFHERTYEKKAEFEDGAIAKGVADITVDTGEITAIAQKKDFIEGHLLSYDDTMIEIEGYGRIAHEISLPVYRVYDVVEQLSISDIVLGNMDVKYIIGDNEVCAVIITAPAEIAQVRVLLLAEDGGKFREEVFIAGTGDVTVSCDDMVKVIPAGMVLNVKEYLERDAETLVLEPVSEQNLFYICKENGEKISNGYSGKMEVRQYTNGYCVVNEVDLETYLYSVVPSEMPSNYQPEALKAQAVCARSYAYIQVLRSDLAEYGAHINDSSSYQVYNNVAKTQASVQAVDQTAGTVMVHNGDVIEAYYFSTSMGYTDTEEVWNPPEGTEAGYLKRVCLNKDEFAEDLSDEVLFKEYLLTETEGCDSDIKFYRWEITADYSESTETVKDILSTRRKASERHITYYKEDGVTETDSMKNFGKLSKIEVAKRSASGCILELMVYFEKGSVKVENEYNIRKVLASGMIGITYQNGSQGKAASLLPSAFCTVELQKDGTYLLCGGGYGHGIGMSQNGANGLAREGYGYMDILNYFYKDIELVDIRS